MKAQPMVTNPDQFEVSYNILNFGLFFCENRISCIGLECEKKSKSSQTWTCPSTSTWYPWSSVRIITIHIISHSILIAGYHKLFSYKKMKVGQDWGAVWSGPKTFHPSSVPLPLHQGLVTTVSKVLPRPNKFANAELMKIPNFLHLTPPAIKKQCEAIKKFCTPWPEQLQTDQQCYQHFPIKYISSDYCHGSPTIRNKLARIVTLQVSW